jgi:DNA-binding beta-propeller fold protein YncE
MAVPSVFISYRRTDTTSGYASWLYERLAALFGPEHVFMDVDSLPLGVDFVEYLDRALRTTDAALILIGPGWLDAVDEAGARRLDDPGDFVRLEVGAALRAGVRVIPVLVDGAQMPKSSRLSEDLRQLARRQALIFQRHGDAAVKELITAVEQAALERELAEHEAAEAAARISDSPALETSPRAESPTLEPTVGMDATAPESPPRPATTETAVEGEERTDVAGPAQAVVPRRRGPRFVILLAAGALIATAAVGVVIAVGSGSGKHNQSLASGAIRVGNSPDGIVVAQGIVWVSNAGDGTITRIHQATGDVVNKISFASHSAPAAPIAFWQDKIWVGDDSRGTVDEINPASGKTIRAIPVGGQPCAVTVASKSLWVANYNDTIARIAGAGPAQLIPAANGSKRFAELNGSLWVANQDAGSVTRIDPGYATIHVGGHPAAITGVGGSLWLADRDRNVITRINPGSGTAIGSPIPIGSDPRHIAPDGVSRWVANFGDGTVTWINSSTGRVATIKVGGHPDAITASDGVVWVGVWSRKTPQYQGPSGGVVRIKDSTGRVSGT